MMLNRAVAPNSLPIEQIRIQVPESLKYSNGLQVFIFQSDEVEIIRFEFVFGNVVESEDFIQLNSVLASMLREGTRTRTSAQIAEEIDFYGAYLIPEYGLDHTTITLYVMSKYVYQVLPIVHDILCESVFPQNELDVFKRNSKQSLAISLKKNAYLARRVFFKEIFGTNNSYGFVPTDESIDAIEPDGLHSLYKKQMVPSNCTLFIAGNMSFETLDLVTHLFSDHWGGSFNSKNESVYSFPSTRGECLYEFRPDSLQSTIRLGRLSICREHEDYPALQFVNTLFGGYFGSRLMRNIRENKGYTYNISSGIIGLKHSGAITVLTEVGVEHTKNTLNEIEHEMNILKTTLVSEDELVLVKSFMKGVLLASMESIFSHVDKFKVAYFSGLSLDYYTYYFEQINEIGSERVQKIAEQYFDYSDFLKVVVGAGIE